MPFPVSLVNQDACMGEASLIRQITTFSLLDADAKLAAKDSSGASGTSHTFESTPVRSLSSAPSVPAATETRGSSGSTRPRTTTRGRPRRFRATRRPSPPSTPPRPPPRHSTSPPPPALRPQRSRGRRLRPRWPPQGALPRCPRCPLAYSAPAPPLPATRRPSSCSRRCPCQASPCPRRF